MRMDAQAPDIARVCKPQMRPGLTPVGRLVDAIAVRDIAADGRLAHADIDDIGIGIGHRHSTHRRGLKKTI